MAVQSKYLYLNNKKQEDGKFHLMVVGDREVISPIFLSFNDWKNALEKFNYLKDRFGYILMEDTCNGPVAVEKSFFR